MVRQEGGASARGVAVVLLAVSGAALTVWQGARAFAGLTLRPLNGHSHLEQGRSRSIDPSLPPSIPRSRVATHAATVLEPPAPPTLQEGKDSFSFIECQVFAYYSKGGPCGDAATCSVRDWKPGYETWVFRRNYVDAFEVLLRKMGYHLPMIYQNVSISCEEKRLQDMAKEMCLDCIRHLTSDAYGEMGMIVPAHPDPKMRGRSDAPALEALSCLTEGKDYSVSAPGSGLFCRSQQRQSFSSL